MFLDAAAARSAFDQLSGELHASQQTARVDDSRYVLEGMDQRLREGAKRWERGRLEAGWRIHTSAGEYEPYLNLAHVRLSSNAGTEVGGDAALHVDSERENVEFSTLGARGAWQFGGTELHGGIGWQHAFGDTTPQRTLQFVAGGDAFTVYGVPVAKNAAVVNFGADWKLSPKVKLEASYDGQWASSADDQAAKLSLSVAF